MATADRALQMAVPLLRRGDVRAALACFEAATAMQPDHGFAHLGRGICLAQLGKLDDAEVAVGRALALPDPKGEVGYHFARFLIKHGDPAGAMEHLDRAIRASPDNARMAWEDVAFDALRDHPRYLQIVGLL